ncbi:TRAP transporter large permease [Pulveribacter sp.]|uniref:TRAP transporter large permease n=1 Tax=Pulveribacter sp. TaxID=2678893 RepID=UPI0028985FE6|nr:TRAP transporter large permease [Pulveribacter sp.]
MSEMAQMGLIAAVFVVLLVGGMWIPFAIALTSVLYILMASGWAGLQGLGLVSWGSTYSFTLTAIPLFVLMAELMLESGLSQRVYRGMSYLVRPLPGGLLQTNVAGCAAFSAISGSSVATAAAVGSIAIPQLRSRGYDNPLAAGTLVAGGTLGILIPPSIAMIIYGTFTDTSIAKLFMAGVVPGLLLCGLFMLYVGVRCLINPRLAPRGGGEHANTSMRELAGDVLPFFLLILLVLGGLYLGFTTPTEAAGVGAVLAFAISKIWGVLGWKQLRAALEKTVMVSGTILFIVYAAYLFSYAIGMVGVTDELADGLQRLGLSSGEFLLLIIVFYTLLGMLMDSIGMIVITVPLLYPLVVGYGFDPVWFGVLLVVLIELGQVTPPTGLNLFVVKSVSGFSLGEIIRGSIPFCLLFYVLIALLYLFPALALWMPQGLK